MGELVAVKYWYSGWWFGTFFIYSHILGISSSQLIFIFLRGVGIPPTSIILIISIVNKMRFEEVHSVVRDHCWLLGWISRSPEKNGWIRPSIASNIYLLFSNRCFLFSYVFSSLAVDPNRWCRAINASREALQGSFGECMVKLRSLLCQTLDNFGSISWTHLRYFKIIYVFVVETLRRIRRICLVTSGDEKLGVINVL